MQNENADRQERTGEQIIDAGDDAEILPDGGEEIDEEDDDYVELPAAHIQTTATVQSVSFEIDAIGDVIKFGVRSTDIGGIVFLGDDEVDELVEKLHAAQEQLTRGE